MLISQQRNNCSMWGSADGYISATVGLEMMRLQEMT